MTRNYIPADFMQTLDVTYNGQAVFRLESDIAISEDPSFEFNLRLSDLATAGVIKAEVFDSNQRHFSQAGRFRLRRRCERSIAHYFSPLLSEQGEFAGP